VGKIAGVPLGSNWLARDLHLTDLHILPQLVAGFEILCDCCANIVQGFYIGRSLRPAAWQSRNGSRDTFFGPLKNNFVSHRLPLGLQIIPEIRFALADESVERFWKLLVALLEELAR